MIAFTITATLVVAIVITFLVCCDHNRRVAQLFNFVMAVMFPDEPAVSVHT